MALFVRQTRLCSRHDYYMRRLLSNSQKNKNKKSNLDPALEEARNMYGKRSNRERVDSVTADMLKERLIHRDRMENISPPHPLVVSLKDRGFGKKKKAAGIYSYLSADPLSTSPRGFLKTDPKTATGAGGHGLHLASAAKNWPVFKHMLPEIAFAGHSNSGKSTLVNAMVGVSPRSGPAGVNERAGWTDRICFYQLARKPPLLTLADLPGYGHAVASGPLKKAWKLMTRDFLSNRPVLSRCYVLVDSVRGLCEEDKVLLRFLQQKQIPWKVILTKCDLLTLEQTGQAMCVVYEDLLALTGESSMSSRRDSAEAVSDSPETDLSVEAPLEREIEHVLSDDEEDGRGAESGDDMELLLRMQRAEDGTDLSEDDRDDRDEEEGEEEDDEEEGWPVGDESSRLLWSHMRQMITPVSASSGAGVSALWTELKECAAETSEPPCTSPMAVREHLRAAEARRLKRVADDEFIARKSSPRSRKTSNHRK